MNEILYKGSIWLFNPVKLNEVIRKKASAENIKRQTYVKRLNIVKRGELSYKTVLNWADGKPVQKDEEIISLLFDLVIELDEDIEDIICKKEREKREKYYTYEKEAMRKSNILESQLENDAEKKKTEVFMNTFSERLGNLKISLDNMVFAVQVRMGTPYRETRECIKKIGKGEWLPSIELRNTLEDIVTDAELAMMREKHFIASEKGMGIDAAEEINRLRANIKRIPLSVWDVQAYFKKIYGYNIDFFHWKKIELLGAYKEFNREFESDVKIFNEFVEKSFLNLYLPEIKDMNEIKLIHSAKKDVVLFITFNDMGVFELKRQRKLISSYYGEKATLVDYGKLFENNNGSSWRGLKNALLSVAEGNAKEIAVIDVRRIREEEVRDRFLDLARALEVKIVEVGIN